MNDLRERVMEATTPIITSYRHGDLFALQTEIVNAVLDLAKKEPRQLTVPQAVSIAHSVVNDAPVRLTQDEWETFRVYLIKKLQHCTLRESGVIIDSSWVERDDRAIELLKEIQGSGISTALRSGKGKLEDLLGVLEKIDRFLDDSR